MNRNFVNLAIAIGAIFLCFAAGFGGARLGMSQAKNTESFPRVVSHLLENSDVGLTVAQQAKIDTLRQGYEMERRSSGVRLQTALIALAEAVIQSVDNPDQTEAAATLVDRIVHERRMASISYISDAREVLDPRQRAIFDKAFLRVVANDPSYSQ